MKKKSNYFVTILLNEDSFIDSVVYTRSEAYALIRRHPEALCWRITYVSSDYSEDRQNELSSTFKI